MAGPMLSPGPVSHSLDSDTTSIDLSAVPMDDIEVNMQPGPISRGTRAASLGDAIAAAVIATPEPATYAITALALLAAGTIRRRK